MPLRALIRHARRYATAADVAVGVVARWARRNNTATDDYIDTSPIPCACGAATAAALPCVRCVCVVTVG